MDNISVAAGQPPISCRTSCDPHDIGEIVQRLLSASSTDATTSGSPTPGVWDDLLALSTSARDLSDTRRQQIESKISTALDGVARDNVDTALLAEVLGAALGPDKVAPTDFLCFRVRESLQLPELTILERGEGAPNGRTFNSVLPLLSASTQKYGPLGRTLLLKGACALLMTSDGAPRSDTLQRTIFLVDTDTEGVDYVAVDKALEAQGLYEPVDIESLRARQDHAAAISGNR